MRFEWDDAKNRSNLRKYLIGFEAAQEAFDDPQALVVPDPYEGEERWRVVGLVRGTVFLTVAHTYRNRAGEEIVRIISARRATRTERHMYERHS